MSISTQKNYFDILPIEIRSYIFSMVELRQSKGIHSLLLTSKLFNSSVSGDGFFWKRVVSLHFPDSFKKNLNSSSFQELYCNLKISKNNKENEIRTNIINNIKSKKFRKTTLTHACQAKCLTLYYDKIIAGSPKGTITVIDLKTQRVLRSFDAHKGSVTSLAVSEDKLLSSSEDDLTIKVWDPISGKNELTIEGHGKVTCLTTHQDTLISSSMDGTIKIWELNTGKELSTIVDHVMECYNKRAVLKVIAHEGKLIAGFDDGPIKVKVWDLFTKEVLQTITLHDRNSSPVTDLVAKGDKFYFCDNHGIHIHDLNNGKELHTLVDSEYRPPRLLALQGSDYLFSGSNSHLNSIFTIWDPNTGIKLHTFTRHLMQTDCIAMRDGRFFSASKDNSIRVTDFNFSS